MADAIDLAFSKAITSIKTLSSRKGLPQPPVENRIHLYGLYKQATEGDVEGIMERPEDATSQLKWDAWKKEEGVDKLEAKRNYVSFLIQTLRDHASGSEEGQEVLTELNELWDQVKDIDLNTLPDPLERAKQEAKAIHSRQPSDRPTGAPIIGEYDARYLESQYWNSPRKKPFPESGNENLRKWQRDVSSALESINQEIVEIRRRHGVPAGNLESRGDYDTPLIPGTHYYENTYYYDDNDRLFMANRDHADSDKADQPPSPPNYTKFRVLRFFLTLIWGSIKHLSIDVVCSGGGFHRGKVQQKELEHRHTQSLESHCFKCD